MKLKDVLSSLMGRKEKADRLLEPKPQTAEPTPPPAEKKEPLYKLNNGFYWEFKQVRNGFGGYKTVDVYLLKMDDPHFKRCIVNHAGEIQNFPGFKDRAWTKDLEYSSEDNKVRFVFGISPYKDGKATVRWVVQPDGRYFEDDDGFGAEHCEEIEMYSALDEDGRFIEPFSRG